MDEESKQYMAFTIGNPGFFKYEWMPFKLCNAPATFQQLMQNCLGELNLTYCLIYLDDMTVFSKMEEEYLHHLHFVFNQFWEHNLKLKPTKCEFFRSEINYVGHPILKDSIRPSQDNLKVIVECTLPQTYTDIQAFLGFVGHYRRFVKGFACTAQPLHEYLSGDGTGKKSELVTLIEEALHASKMLREACITTPALAFADYEKPFLLETNVSKEGLGAVLSQKQAEGFFHPVAYGSQAWLLRSETTIPVSWSSWQWSGQSPSTSRKYLSWRPFIVWTDNNPLPYIMTTPNIDVTRHQWVESLVQYTFDIEYQKGWDNTTADILSRMTTRLDAETVKLVLNCVSMGASQWAGTHDPLVIEAREEIDKQT